MQRIKLLYEVTMYSYENMYNYGRNHLRNQAAKYDKIEIKIGGKSVFRPLSKITYHARDVYPDLLRSTLLIRLVASFEAFLIDAVREVSSRSKVPFLTDAPLHYTHEQILTIDQQEGLYSHIVDVTLRKFSGSGLKEIRKFYIKRLDFDILDNDSDFEKLQEIHDRRHIFVHRDGYADEMYVKKYGLPSTGKEKKLNVSEAYLLRSISHVDAAALHVKRNIEDKFPEQQIRRYIKGEVELPSSPSKMLYISYIVITSKGRDGISDLSLEMENGKKLKDITVWISDDGENIRLLLGCEDEEIKYIYKLLDRMNKTGDIRNIDSFKIKR